MYSWLFLISYNHQTV